MEPRKRKATIRRMRGDREGQEKLLKMQGLRITVRIALEDCT